VKLDEHVVVLLAKQPTDFRKSIDGLALEIGRALGRDPMSGELFVFYNRRKNALKALRWTTNGFVLLYKRLERHTFVLPDWPDAGEDLVLPRATLYKLLEGLTREVGVPDDAP
jgi:transposase